MRNTRVSGQWKWLLGVGVILVCLSIRSGGPMHAFSRHLRDSNTSRQPAVTA